ncbi:MAG: CHASE3 domain-containing protein [Deltaproteobacteria bacterium]|nr:CHASE3 domain-containing protein [Deltaproteobacteria bacterium]
MQFSTGQKIGATFGFALLALSGASVVSSRAMTDFAQAAGRVEQSLQVLTDLNGVSARLLAAELGQRNYLLTGDESELETYHVAAGATQQELGDLRHLTADNPHQQQRLVTLEPLVTKAFADLQETIDLQRQTGVAAAQTQLLEGQGKPVINHIGQVISEMQEAEQDLFKTRHEDLNAIARWMFFAVITRNVLALLFVAVSGLVVYRDVAARTRTEAALRESEARVKAQYKGIPIPTYTWQKSGEDFVLVDYNDAAEILTRGGMANLMGKPASETHKERPEVVKILRQCAAEKAVLRRELPYRLLTTGEDKYLAITCAFVPPDLLVLHTEDITARKRAEAELARLKHQQELILRSVADGIQVLDLQGKVIFVNPAAVRMIGDEAEELIGQSMHETLHHSKSDGTPYPREECPISLTLQDGSLHHVTNEVFWRRDGTSFPVEYTSAPIREQGEVAGTVVTFRDISEQRAVERLKDEFISVVSHELRTPLTSIRGALGLLTSGLIGALPEKGQRMLEIAVNNTDRLVRLINDILDIERMQSGKVTMQRQLCDAGALLTQATDEMRGLAEKAGITLAVTPQPLQLWADPDRVVQTLTNLVSNAIKFSTAGGTVWVSVALQGEEAIFTVRDQGRGIPADKRESIFERFQQVDASDSRQKGGTGLGLAICRSIVQQHGGRIWVESTVGQGSTFYFTLPARREAEESMSALPGPPLVLVCDDDPSVLEVVGAMLEQHGYQVLKAASGQEAIERALVTRPAAILLDLLMPGMSGWETMAVLKERPETSNIPLIILSGVQRQNGNLLPPTNSALSSGQYYSSLISSYLTTTDLPSSTGSASRISSIVSR